MSFSDELFSRGSQVINYDHMVKLMEAGDTEAAFEYFTKHQCQVARELAAARQCFSLFGSSLPRMLSELKRLTELSRAQDLKLRRMHTRLVSRIDAETLKFIETGENGRDIPLSDPRMTTGEKRKKIKKPLDPNERLRKLFASKMKQQPVFQTDYEDEDES